MYILGPMNLQVSPGNLEDNKAWEPGAIIQGPEYLPIYIYDIYIYICNYYFFFLGGGGACYKIV